MLTKTHGQKVFEAAAARVRDGVLQGRVSDVTAGTQPWAELPQATRDLWEWWAIAIKTLPTPTPPPR